MTLYVDTSALLKLYVEEAESSACEAHLAGDDDWVTGRHTLVEMRRNLARLLARLLDGAYHADAVAQFTDHWQRFRVVESMRPCVPQRLRLPSRPALARSMRCTWLPRSKLARPRS